MPVQEQTRETAPGEAAIFRPCANCNAGLIFGQEWCLECGERQPSHETKLRGRRTAALITGGVLALAIIGFSLTWVALKDDARGASRDLLASAPGAAGDVAGQTPATGQAQATGQPVPGSTGTTGGIVPGTGLTPSTTTPLDPSKLPKVGGATPSFIPITPSGTGGASTTITSTGTTTTGGSTTTGTTGGATTTTTKKKKATAVVLPKVPKAPKYQGGFSPTNAFDQDPFGTDGVENARLVRNAIDRDPKTAWATQDYPNGLGKPGVGIYFDVGSAMNLNHMKITTDTPGFNVRIYGAADFQARTAKVPGPGWSLLSANTLSAASTSVGLFTQSTKYQYYLVWIMSLPPDSQHVDINEVSFHAPKA